MKKRKVAVAGGFDPLHIGHIRHFKEAKVLGDELIVFLNTDEWLKKKKGYSFMPWEERREVIESIKYVDKVVKVIDKGPSVSKTLEKYKPDIFAKGGDRNIFNIPGSEIQVCKKYNIKLVFGVGGEKIQSSSWLLNSFAKKKLSEIAAEYPER